MAKLFNDTELLERVDNDVGFLAETVDMLDTDGRKLLAETQAAVAASDAAAIGRSAHALKGMISNFCADSVQAMALEVEKAGKAGDAAAAAAVLPALAANLESLIVELRHSVAERS